MIYVGMKRRGAANSDSEKLPSLLGMMSAISLPPNVNDLGPTLRRALTRPAPFPRPSDSGTSAVS